MEVRKEKRERWRVKKKDDVKYEEEVIVKEELVTDKNCRVVGKG